MTSDPARLILLTPQIGDAERFRPDLAAACGAGPIAAVLLQLAAADERSMVNAVKRLASAAQAEGAAVLVCEPALPFPLLDLATLASRGGADGIHLRRPAEARTWRARLGSDRSLGVAGLRTRHDAMDAGEAGADFVLFGEPRPDGSVPALDDVVERAAWWAEIFQVPCAAFAPTLDAVPRLAATGAEFVVLGDAVWQHPDGPAAAIAAAIAALNRSEVPA